jgi:hypothetical protein
MFESVLSLIKAHSRIILHRHQNPDGDALGAQIGLYHILKENFPEKEAEIPFYKSFSGGIIGKAVALCESGEFSSLRSEVTDLLKNFPKSRFGALKLADFFKEREDKEAMLFDITLSFFRDIAVLKEGSDDFLNSDIAEKIEEAGKSVSKKGIVAALSLLTEAKGKKAKNAIYDLWITNLFIEMWEVLNG